MSPILGILASQGKVAANSYESISTVTVGAGGSSSISFSSIPSTYKHLQIRYIARSTDTGTALDNAVCRFNGDTTSGNYTGHYLYGNGSATGAGRQGDIDRLLAGRITGGSAGSSQFGVVVFDILDYTNTNKYKTTRNLSGYDSNGSGEVFFESGLWMSTAAISSINIFINSSFAQYSSFALYGVKG